VSPGAPLDHPLTVAPLTAGIFPENCASVALHERCGFAFLGTRHRIGQMHDGRWRDVLLYERRSAVVGCD
jgi:phosphinothricin acetyltransferase